MGWRIAEPCGDTLVAFASVAFASVAFASVRVDSAGGVCAESVGEASTVTVSVNVVVGDGCGVPIGAKVSVTVGSVANSGASRWHRWHISLVKPWCVTGAGTMLLLTAWQARQFSLPNSV